LRPLWYVELIKKSFPKVRFIAKLTRIPILAKLFDLAMFQGDDIIYLTQDNIIPVNKDIQKESDMVLPSQVIEYFIEKANYHWVMNFCICRESMKCENYPINLGCLFLGEAVLGINPHLGKRVTKKEALNHIKRCQEAGLVHMVGRNKLDASWLGVKPGNKLLSICNCCPDCCLWRVAPILTKKIGRKVKKMPGINVKVTEKCIGCGTCTQGICFVNAIHLINKRAFISEECRGCGRCVDICPQKAIELTIDDKLFVKKSIKRIETLVDVT